MLGERDNHYTMESGLAYGWQLLDEFIEVKSEYFVSSQEHFYDYIFVTSSLI